MEGATPQHILQIPEFIANISPQAMISVVFTLIFIWWVIYTLVAIYHWFRYGRSSWIAVPAVVAHLVVSGAIFIFMTSGLN